MQFFMNGNGVIQASFPYSVNQGGQDAYEINLYAPFAAGTVITASFKLPNGEIKSGYQLTEIGAVNDVKIAGAPARLWRMAIPGEITQYYGTVTAQFFVSTATGTLPSSSTSFIVARGVPQVIDDTSPLDTITENIASLQTDLNNGYFSARALREWNALYTYGLGELVYVSEDDGNVLLESLKADNTDPPYVDGQLNTDSWKVALDKFVTPLSDTAPLMDGVASAGSAPEAARGDHVHPTDTTRAAAADLTNEISTRQAADTALQQAVALKQNSTDNNLTTTAKTIVGAINENSTAIAGLQQDFINEDHFKGFAATSADVQAITANANDFVYCVETGTIWTYNNGWTNSNEPYPSDATPLATTTPLMDGTATVGSSSSAARADHVHPTDTALAGRIDDLEDGTTPAGRVGNTLTVVVGDTTTTYDGSSSQTVNVPVAGIQGTLSATINGSAKTYNGSADVALGSLYAPTTAGTDGYILASNGSGAPSWVSPSKIVVTTETTTSYQKSITISNYPASYVIGTILLIKFTYAVSNSSNYTLGINGLTRRSIIDKYGNNINSSAPLQWQAGDWVLMILNSNNQWQVLTGLTGDNVGAVLGGSTGYNFITTLKAEAVVSVEATATANGGLLSIASGGSNSDYNITRSSTQSGRVIGITALCPAGKSLYIERENVDSGVYHIQYISY